MKDCELAILARGGCKSSLNELCSRWWFKIYNYVYKLEPIKENAEDITQNTLIRLTLNIEKFDETKKFDSWMYTIAKNQIKTFWKTKKYTEELSDILACSCNNLEESVVYIDRAIKVHKAVNKLLHNGYQETLKKYYFEDKNYNEISKEMNIPIGTVGTFLIRGKKELKADLKDLC